MEAAIFILGMIAVLGTFSLYKNGKKKSIITNVIQEYLDENKGELLDTEKTNFSGPFKDAYFDQQGSNLYQNVGYQAKETIYRKITFKDAKDNNKVSWLQLRVENLKPTYVEWKEEA